MLRSKLAADPPADFVPDAVPLCEPISRGGLGHDLDAFVNAWGREVKVGTDHLGRPAISATDAARIHAYGVAEDARRQAAALRARTGMLERARQKIAARAAEAEKRREEEAEADRRRRSGGAYTVLPRTGPTLVGVTGLDGKPVGLKPPPPEPEPPVDRDLLDLAAAEFVQGQHRA